MTINVSLLGQGEIPVLGPAAPDRELFVSRIVEVGFDVWQSLKTFHKPEPRNDN